MWLKFLSMFRGLDERKCWVSFSSTRAFSISPYIFRGLIEIYHAWLNRCLWTLLGCLWFIESSWNGDLGLYHSYLSPCHRITLVILSPWNNGQELSVSLGDAVWTKTRPHGMHLMALVEWGLHWLRPVLLSYIRMNRSFRLTWCHSGSRQCPHSCCLVMFENNWSGRPMGWQS